MATLGSLLVDAKACSAQELKEALQNQAIFGGRLDTNLLELGTVNEETLAKTLSKLHGVRSLYGEVALEPAVLSLVPRDVADRLEIVPYRLQNRKLELLVVDPADLKTMDEASFITGKRLDPIIVTESRMWHLLRQGYGLERQLRGIDVDFEQLKSQVDSTSGTERPDASSGLDAPVDLQDEASFQALYDSGQTARGAVAEPAPPVQAPAGPAQAPRAAPPVPRMQPPAQAPPHARPPSPSQRPPHAQPPSLSQPPPRAQQPPAAQPPTPARQPRAQPPSAQPPRAAPSPPPAAPSPPSARQSRELARPEQSPPPVSAPHPAVPPPEPAVFELSLADMVLEEMPPLTFAEATAALEGVTDRNAIAQIVLRYARSRFRRAVLLTVQRSYVNGWEGLGEGLDPSRVHRIRVKLGSPGIFETAVENRAHYLGPLQKTEANIRFLRALAGGAPKNAFLIPILVMGRVVNVLYADNGRGGWVDVDVGELLILATKIAKSYDTLISAVAEG